MSDVADMASMVAMPSVVSVANMHDSNSLNREMDLSAAMYVANPVDGLNGCDQAAKTGEIWQITGFSLM